MGTEDLYKTVSGDMSGLSKEEAQAIAKKILEEADAKKAAAAAAAAASTLTKSVATATAAEVGATVAAGAAVGFAIGSLAPVWTSNNPRYNGFTGVGLWWYDTIFGP